MCSVMRPREFFANKHKTTSDGRETQSLRSIQFLACWTIKFAHSFVVRGIVFHVFWLIWHTIVEILIKRTQSRQCGMAPLSWEITTLESDSISTFPHPCLATNFTPLRITIVSIISTLLHLLRRFKPSIISPLEFQAITTIPPIPVCLHHDASQLIQVTSDSGADHVSTLRLGLATGWFIGFLPCSSIAALISDIKTPGCGIFVLNAVLHLAFHICQAVIILVVYLACCTSLEQPGSFMRYWNHCSMDLSAWFVPWIPSIPNQTTRVHLHSNEICSIVFILLHIGHSVLTFGRPWCMGLLLTAMGLVASFHI